MPRNEILSVVRDFLGINRRDGAARASDREFLTIQNFFRKEKGVLYKRFGSTDDLQASDVPGCDRITAIQRHPVYPCPKSVLYHCTPTSTAITHPGSTGLTITEVTSASGTIFDAASAASRVVHFCYSYIGMGVESSWDARARAGYISYSGSDINAWDQLGLETWVLAASTNTLQVSHPSAFPSDVRAVNVFMSIGDPTDGANRRNLVYVGTLKSTSDVLDVDVSIGAAAARADSFTAGNFQVEARYDSTGDFPPGTYYVSLAWVADGEAQTQLGLGFNASLTLCAAKSVTLNESSNAIGVHYYEATGASTNGATHCYAFVGVKDEKSGVMTCVGAFRIGTVSKVSGLIDTLVIKKVPYNTNAQTAVDSTGTTASFIHVPHQLDSTLQIRHGFVVKKDSDRPISVSEVFPSRSNFSWDSPTVGNTLDPFYLLIRTPEDRLANNAAAYVNPNVGIPSLAYFNGSSYFANGRDFLNTDGIGMAKMAPKNGCVIPTNPTFLFTFKDQLVCGTIDNKNVIYGSNALQANNWSDGGTGTNYRFAVLGDPFEGSLTAASVFAFTTGTDGPRAFLVGFKKNSCWSLTNVPDSTSGINAQADQMSGRVGCLAGRTIVQTKLGLLFLGSDGDIYMIRGSGEPLPIGSKIKPLLKHLAQDDTLMKMCVAVYHDNFYKLAYPSSAASTYNDAQLWADLRTEDGNGIQWDGPHTGINIGCQIALVSDNDSGDRIAGLADAAGSAKLDDESTYQDLGTDISSVLEWTVRRFNAEFNYKKYKGVFLEAFYDTTDAQSVLVEGFSDLEYAQRNLTLSTGDAASGEAAWRRHILYFQDDNLVGSDFKFKITHDDNTQFTLSAVGVALKPERRLAI